MREAEFHEAKRRETGAQRAQPVAHREHNGDPVDED
jgi:hypothetical protein